MFPETDKMTIRDRINLHQGLIDADLRLLAFLNRCASSGAPALVHMPLTADMVCDHDYPKRGPNCMGCADIDLKRTA